MGRRHSSAQCSGNRAACNAGKGASFSNSVPRPWRSRSSLSGATGQRRPGPHDRCMFGSGFREAACGRGVTPTALPRGAASRFTAVARVPSLCLTAWVRAVSVEGLVLFLDICEASARPRRRGSMIKSTPGWHFHPTSRAQRHNTRSPVFNASSRSHRGRVLAQLNPRSYGAALRQYADHGVVRLLVQLREDVADNFHSSTAARP